ncbi:MAG: DUF3465 domain-containing protein [Frateuria sp.]|nr:DUF3465 domain-containing protein [Frateuria sp.]
MKKLVWVIVLVVGAYAGYQGYGPRSGPVGPPASPSGVRLDAAAGHTQVQGSGIVVRILPDDTEGSRHQRFILRLPSGQTLLVAHNIDLAPRVSGLKEGDRVEYSGEYEWNPKGGVLHWTHLDPAGRHAAGWLKHDGRTFQ